MTEDDTFRILKYRKYTHAEISIRISSLGCAGTWYLSDEQLEDVFNKCGWTLAEVRSQFLIRPAKQGAFLG